MPQQNPAGNANIQWIHSRLRRLALVVVVAGATPARNPAAARYPDESGARAGHERAQASTCESE